MNEGPWHPVPGPCHLPEAHSSLIRRHLLWPWAGSATHSICGLPARVLPRLPGSAIPAPPQSSVGPWVCAADGPEGNGPLLGLGLLPGLERLSGPSSHRQPEGDSVSATLLPPAPGTPGHTAATGQTGTWRSLGLCGSLSVSPLSSVAFPLPSEPSGRGQCWRGTEEKSRA